MAITFGAGRGASGGRRGGMNMSSVASQPVGGGNRPPAGVPYRNYSLPQAPAKGYSMRDIIMHRAQPGYSNVTDPRTKKRLTIDEARDRGPLYMSGWNTSGVGPGTDGYRGSYRNGAYNYGEGVGRPEGEISGARTSSEYYAARDQQQGNPLDNIWMGNRNNMNMLSERIRAEAGGNSNPAFNVVHNPDGSTNWTPNWGGQQQKPLTMSSAPYGTKTQNGQMVPLTAEEFQQMQREADMSRIQSQYGAGPTSILDYNTEQPAEVSKPSPIPATNPTSYANANASGSGMNTARGLAQDVLAPAPFLPVSMSYMQPPTVTAPAPAPRPPDPSMSTPGQRLYSNLMNAEHAIRNAPMKISQSVGEGVVKLTDKTLGNLFRWWNTPTPN